MKFVEYNLLVVWLNVTIKGEAMFLEKPTPAGCVYQ